MTHPRKIAVLGTLGWTLNLSMQGRLRYLSQVRGFEVHAVAHPDEDLAELAEREGVSIRPIPMSKYIAPLEDLRSLLALIRLFRREGYQVVEASNPKGGLLGMLAAWWTGVPVRIFLAHGVIHIEAQGWKRWLVRGMEALTCRLAQKILCVSPSLRDFLVSEGLATAEKAVVLGPGSCGGVDARERFCPSPELASQGAALRTQLGIPQEVPLALFVGRLKRAKGVLELGRAWQETVSRHPSAHLLLLAPEDWQTEQEVSSWTELRDQTPGLHWLPFDSRVEHYYAAADFLVLPSHREGLPTVVLEASAMELPVVTTDAIGCRDAVLEGETGWIVPRGDPAALASALDRVLTMSPEARRAMGRAGRSHVLSTYAPEQVWERQGDFLEGLLRH